VDALQGRICNFLIILVGRLHVGVPRILLRSVDDTDILTLVSTATGNAAQGFPSRVVRISASLPMHPVKAAWIPFMRAPRALHDGFDVPAGDTPQSNTARLFAYL
jgi:hypothetical protein